MEPKAKRPFDAKFNASTLLPSELNDTDTKLKLSCLYDSEGNILKIYIWDTRASVKVEPIVTLKRGFINGACDLIVNEQFKTFIRDRDIMFYYLMWPSAPTKGELFQELSPETKETVEGKKEEIKTIM